MENETYNPSPETENFDTRESLREMMREVSSVPDYAPKHYITRMAYIIDNGVIEHEGLLLDKHFYSALSKRDWNISQDITLKWYNPNQPLNMSVGYDDKKKGIKEYRRALFVKTPAYTLEHPNGTIKIRPVTRFDGNGNKTISYEVAIIPKNPAIDTSSNVFQWNGDCSSTKDDYGTAINQLNNYLMDAIEKIDSPINDKE